MMQLSPIYLIAFENESGSYWETDRDGKLYTTIDVQAAKARAKHAANKCVENVSRDVTIKIFKCDPGKRVQYPLLIVHVIRIKNGIISFEGDF